MCIVEQDLPLNIREIGDLTELAYRVYEYVSYVKLTTAGIISIPCSLAALTLPSWSDPQLIEPLL